MQIDVRDQDGTRLGRVELDEVARPLRIRPPLADRDLRSCVVCGHPRVYRARSLPQMTPFVVLLALGLAMIALLGFATSPAFLALLAVVLALDIGVLVLARTQLICYRCGSVYERLGIARYHRHWDPAIAERDTPSAGSDQSERTS
jgi:ribosomal protein L37E